MGALTCGLGVNKMVNSDDWCDHSKEAPVYVPRVGGKKKNEKQTQPQPLHAVGCSWLLLLVVVVFPVAFGCSIVDGRRSKGKGKKVQVRLRGGTEAMHLTFVEGLFLQCRSFADFSAESSPRLTVAAVCCWSTCLTIDQLTPKYRQQCLWHCYFAL